MMQRASRSRAGFTLVELLIGVALSAAMMAAVLSSYVFLGRSLARLINQQTLETEARRTLTYFAQDVRMASGISGSPSTDSLVLTLPTSTGTATVTYTHAGNTLTRTPSGGTALVLTANLQSFYFRYFDDSSLPFDNGLSPYTTQTSYLASIKQVSMTFSTQTGTSGNGTQTPVAQYASPRLVLRNRPLLQ